jgi:hypothetical protein
MWVLFPTSRTGEGANFKLISPHHTLAAQERNLAHDRNLKVDNDAGIANLNGIAVKRVQTAKPKNVSTRLDHGRSQI